MCFPNDDFRSHFKSESAHGCAAHEARFANIALFGAVQKLMSSVRPYFPLMRPFAKIQKGITWPFAHFSYNRSLNHAFRGDIRLFDFNPL